MGGLGKSARCFLTKRKIRGSSDIQDDLVEKLHCVAAEHERHEPEVDTVAQSIDVDSCGAGSVAMLIQEVPGVVDMSLGGVQEA